MIKNECQALSARLERGEALADNQRHRVGPLPEYNVRGATVTRRPPSVNEDVTPVTVWLTAATSNVSGMT